MQRGPARSLQGSRRVTERDMNILNWINSHGLFFCGLWIGRTIYGIIFGR